MSHSEGPPILILQAPGTNCHRETFTAYKQAGGDPHIVTLNELETGEEKMKNYKMLAVPGGWAHGDHLGAGKVLSLTLLHQFADDLKEFIEGPEQKLVLGVCNGCQVLMRTGLTPFGTIGEMQATMEHNNSGHFECRRVDLSFEQEHGCLFLQGFKPRMNLQVAHGEGKFYTQPHILDSIEQEHLVVARYINLNKPEEPWSMEYPFNPNGSLDGIAAITNPKGNVLALMPHPERQNINGIPDGLEIFRQMVGYINQT